MPRASQRLWIFNHYAYPPAAGVLTRHFDLARELRRHGIATTLISSSFNHYSGLDDRLAGRRMARSEVIDGVRFLWVKTTPYRGNGAKRAINMLSYAATAFVGVTTLRRPDAIVGSSIHPFAALTGYVAARQRRVPFTYEIRDFWPQTLVDMDAMSPDGPTARLLWGIETFLHGRADAVVSVMPRGEEYFEMRGLPHREVHYIPNGMNPARDDSDAAGAQPQIAAIRAMRERGEVVFLYAGSHGVLNRLDVLIEAAACARTGEGLGAPPVRLALMGDGAEKQGLMAHARSVGATNVTFLDPVPRGAVHAVLQEVDFGVVSLANLPVFRFGISPNKLFDYAAARRPVLLVVPEPGVEAGMDRFGVRAEPEDVAAIAAEMRRMAAMPESTRMRMGRAARRYALDRHDQRALALRLAAAAGLRVPAPDASHTSGRG